MAQAQPTSTAPQREQAKDVKDYYLSATKPDGRGGTTTDTGKWSLAKRKTALEGLKYISLIPHVPRSTTVKKASNTATTNISLTGSIKKMGPPPENAKSSAAYYISYLDMIPYSYLVSVLNNLIDQAGSKGFGPAIDYDSVLRLRDSLDAKSRDPETYGIDVVFPTGKKEIVEGGEPIRVAGNFDEHIAPLLEKYGLTFLFLHHDPRISAKIIEEIRQFFTYHTSPENIKERSEALFERFESEIIRIKQRNSTPPESEVSIQNVLDMARHLTKKGTGNDRHVVVRTADGAVLQKGKERLLPGGSETFKAQFLEVYERAGREMGEVKGGGLQHVGRVDITKLSKGNGKVELYKMKGGAASKKVTLPQFSFNYAGGRTTIPRGMVVVSVSKGKVPLNVQGIIETFFSLLGEPPSAASSAFNGMGDELAEVTERDNRRRAGLASKEIRLVATDSEASLYARPGNRTGGTGGIAGSTTPSTADLEAQGVTQVPGPGQEEEQQGTQ